MGRREAYKIAQKHAAASWEGADFKTSVMNDPEVQSRLSEPQLEEVFSLAHHLRNKGAKADF
jgi:adenylosuccinate lyase